MPRNRTNTEHAIVLYLSRGLFLNTFRMPGSVPPPFLKSLDYNGGNRRASQSFHKRFESSSKALILGARSTRAPNVPISYSISLGAHC